MKIIPEKKTMNKLQENCTKLQKDNFFNALFMNDRWFPWLLLPVCLTREIAPVKCTNSFTLRQVLCVSAESAQKEIPGDE